MRLVFFQKKENIILLVIVILAFLFRTAYLGIFPPAFHQDEALNGYEAYSILKTGYDHRGNYLPIFFEGFSNRMDNRLPLYIYFTIPIITLFGLNEFATRLTAAIFGTLTVLIVYFLTKRLFKEKNIALFSSLFLAISPWHLLLSRTAMEPVLVPFFFSLAFLFLLKGIEGNKKNLILSAIFLSFLLYTHHSVKVFLPIFLIVALLILFKKYWKRLKIELSILFLIFLISLVPYFLNLSQQSAGRLAESMFIFLIFPFWQWPLIVIYNLLTYLLVAPFFFCYFLTIIFAVFGVFLIWRERKNIGNQLLLLALGVSLLPGILFYQNPHFLRTAAIVPFLETVSALGFWWILQKIKNKKVFLSFIVLFIILNIFIIVRNATRVPFVSFQKNFKAPISYIRKIEGNYEKVIFTNKVNQPYIYFLFYLKYPPKKFQEIKVEREYLPTGWQVVISFDKYLFCNIDQCYSPKDHNLYVATSKEIPGIKAKKIFYNLDGSVFRIITNER